ncbi:MAG: hypothetical protein ABW167_09245 [Baekduia sp.]
MPPATATYDHATAVADILARYYRTEMALRRSDASTLERKHLQDGRTRDEDRFAKAQVLSSTAALSSTV